MTAEERIAALEARVEQLEQQLRASERRARLRGEEIERLTRERDDALAWADHVVDAMGSGR